MKRKIAWVAGGYLAAFLTACAVVAIYIASTDGPDRIASGGMYAFGDLLLFLAVFAIASVPATGAALFFLRANSSFWRGLSVASLAIAATGLAASFLYFAAQAPTAGAITESWSALAVLRLLAAPLFALAFFLSGCFAPNRSPRMVLFATAFTETIVFASFASFLWFGSTT